MTPSLLTLQLTAQPFPALCKSLKGMYFYYTTRGKLPHRCAHQMHSGFCTLVTDCHLFMPYHGWQLPRNAVTLLAPVVCVPVDICPACVWLQGQRANRRGPTSCMAQAMRMALFKSRSGAQASRDQMEQSMSTFKYTSKVCL